MEFIFGKMVNIIEFNDIILPCLIQNFEDSGQVMA